MLYYIVLNTQLFSQIFVTFGILYFWIFVPNVTRNKRSLWNLGNSLITNIAKINHVSMANFPQLGKINLSACELIITWLSVLRC